MWEVIFTLKWEKIITKYSAKKTRNFQGNNWEISIYF